jgi:hypothetical protein
MQSSVSANSGGELRYKALRRNTLIATPVTLLVPVAFALVLAWLGAELSWSKIGIGALGWVGALMLRGPLAAILSQTVQDEDRVKNIIVTSSGPIEEGVRVVLLLLAGRSFSDAAAIGLGWAAIEVLYTVVTSFLTLSLLQRTDPEAMQARQILEAQGMIRETGPWLGIIERIGATALHIGFTLIVAWNLVAAVATAIVHSTGNMALIRTFKKNPIATELGLLGVGTAAFALGVALVR